MKFRNVTDEGALKHYLGKKAISRLGCYGCHDIPGFENAKSIGVGLNDWGKKPADRLAFEDIDNFFKKHYYPVADRRQGARHGIEGGRQGALRAVLCRELWGPSANREGYLNQKIRDPRSYDYNRIRAWDDRARMPKFTLRSPAQERTAKTTPTSRPAFSRTKPTREAVATFVLGLVAEQVPPKSINQPTGDRLAEVKGRQVLDKYNCAGCHLIATALRRGERNRQEWTLDPV